MGNNIYEWNVRNELEKKYHDDEWCFPKFNERELFELLILEGMQAGLSWATVLNKRENMRKAFDDFNIETIAKYDDWKIQQLMEDQGIIRNRRKLESMVNNANCFMEIQREFKSFRRYIWGFTNDTQVVGNWDDSSQIPATTPLSDRISKDLKQRGFKFVGSTIIYSYLQAIGIVNDHVNGCIRKEQCSFDELELIDVYDENKVKTGKVVRRGGIFRKPGEYQLVVHVSIFNSKGQLLIQQRKKNKRNWPGMWDVSAAGGVDADETSREGAERETLEEVGLKISLEGMRPKFSISYSGGMDDHWFVNGDFSMEDITIQDEEVEDVKWVNKEELLELVKNKQFIPYYFIENIFDINQSEDGFMIGE